MYMLASPHTVSVPIYMYTTCALIFAGFMFHIISVFVDFVFLNSLMLAIVPCVSIDI